MKNKFHKNIFSSIITLGIVWALCAMRFPLFSTDMVRSPSIIPYALEIPMFEGSSDNAYTVAKSSFNDDWLDDWLDNDHANDHANNHDSNHNNQPFSNQRDTRTSDKQTYSDESADQPDYYTDFAYLFREAQATDPEIKKIEKPKSHPEHEIIRYTDWTLSFNNTLKVTEWIAYTTSRTKRSTRYSVMRNTFVDDPYLDDVSPSPEDYVQVFSAADPAPENFIQYEKAQLIHAAAFNYNPTAFRESYYMGNVVPQTRSLAFGAWAQLGHAIQNAQDTYERMWVIAGSIWDDSGDYAELGESRTVIPTHYFKVILALLHESDGKKYFAAQAFVMPNTPQTANYREYSCTIAEVEELTGYTFFAKLDAKTAAELKNKNSLKL
ncbi:MAG: hypothetical protein Ta2A_22410 [Treponemataceae bacterium]|nr:MAG: hypothetical protein Ta2A_22410 [Treponemataceae bacterium]